jgi:hypothetical protein
MIEFKYSENKVFKFKDEEEYEFFEERCAIREFLGNYSVKYAERLAFEEVLERRKKSNVDTLLKK